MIGIGCDIVLTHRIEQFLERNGDIGKSLILTTSEMNIVDIQSIAGIFAAKEAFLKALGIGFTRGLKRLTEIEVIKENDGQPRIKTYGLIHIIKQEKKISNIHLSISHDGLYAIAFVVLS